MARRRSSKKDSSDFGIKLLIYIFGGMFFIAIFGSVLIIVAIGYLILMIAKYFIKKYKEKEERNSLDILMKNNFDVNSKLCCLSSGECIINNIHTFSNTTFLWSKKLIDDNNDYYFKSNIMFSEINMAPIICDIYNDIKMRKNYDDLNCLFCETYFSEKFLSCFANYLDEIKQKVDNSAKLNKCYKPFCYDDYISLIKENLVNLYIGKLKSLFDDNSVNIKNSIFSSQMYSIDLSYHDYYVDDLIYLVDTYVTCLCISKLFFIENHIINIDDNTEFYQILNNMICEVKSIDLVSKKIKPIYHEFYQEQFGNVDDDLLLKMIISILYSKNFNNNKVLFERKCDTFKEFDDCMNDAIQKSDFKTDICNSIIDTLKFNVFSDNLVLYLNIIKNIDNYEKSFNQHIEHCRMLKEKERYLAGDFNKEKNLARASYNLDNIDSGTQFELYLKNIFKQLNYKVKHIGKAGDQGADLILKYDDVVYAVQAKFYNSKLDNTPIQEVVGSLKYHNADQGVVITNSSFSNGAKDLAKANNVILIDGKSLKKLIDYTFEDNNGEDVMKRFL